MLGASPDPRCSPGAVSSKLTTAVICALELRTGPISNVPSSEKHAVEMEYGLAAKPYGSTLEIEHIVSLEVANLHPEKADAHPGYHA